MIADILEQSSRVKRRMAADEGFCRAAEGAARRLLQVKQAGGTIYTCGNGGSACDAMHFAEELVARYKRPRPGIRARHLLDAGILTCWSNDESFEGVFRRQVETLCEPRDALVAFSTSGNSANVAEAVRAALEIGAFTLGLLGKEGGGLAGLCDISLVVPSRQTERIQEAHITLVHYFCEHLEAARPGESG